MPADPVFLDTNGWIAILNASDTLHAPALSAWRDINAQRRTLVLTDWIIAETGNGLARTTARSGFCRAVEIVLSSPRVTVVHVDHDLLRRAVRLYADRADKGWGIYRLCEFRGHAADASQGCTDERSSFRAGGFRQSPPRGSHLIPVEFAPSMIGHALAPQQRTPFPVRRHPPRAPGRPPR